MDAGSKQEKSTGFTPPIKVDSGQGLALQKSTDERRALPLSKIVPTKGESSNSEVEVLASNILAIQVMMGDFKAVKTELPESWQTSNGKIYWCVAMPGHVLEIKDGKLLVDEIAAENLLAKLLAG